MAQYFSAQALVSQRSSGFKSTTHAIAEIVDNAFDAGANNIDIYFIERKSLTSGFFSVDEILILDDGYGMPAEVLAECLTFGKTGNEDEEIRVAQKKLGKFGYGLPNSSLSQCPKTTVYSWISPKNIFSTTMDLEKILKANSINIPTPKKVKLPQHFSLIGINNRDDSGTIVHWENCDRLKPKRANKLIEHCERLLGRIFRYMISNDKIIRFHHFQENNKTNSYSRISEMKNVVCNDPLYLTPDSTLAPILWNASQNASSVDVQNHFKKFVVSKTKSKPTNLLVEEHSFEDKFIWNGKAYKFEIKSTAADIDIQKPGVRDGGKTDVGRAYREKMEMGSISFVRSNREIDAGNFKLYKNSDTPYRWWSIEIKFDSDLDDLIGVANNKQYIEFENTFRDAEEDEYNPATASLSEAREALWVKLSILLKAAIKDLKKIISDNETAWKEAQASGGTSAIPTSTSTTQIASTNTDGEGSQLTAEQKEMLLKVLKEKYPKIKEVDILRAIDNFDKMKCKGILLYAYSEADRLLWSFTRVRGFLIITVNTNHNFYQNILDPLIDQNDESILTSLELFISSLAWSEALEQDDKKQNILADFRQNSSSHLSRYIRDNDISLKP